MKKVICFFLGFLICVYCAACKSNNNGIASKKTDKIGSLAPKDRIPFAVRGRRFVRICPDRFHDVYGRIEAVSENPALVSIHSCRTRYRTTLRLQGVY